MIKRLALLLTFALFLLLPTSVAAAECQFVLGFATLRDLIGHEIVGECLENEHHGANGDALQQTAGGLLVWRKADNWTAFTDGYRTWINGPNGLVQRLNTERFAWEADYAPGGGIATPTPTPVPTPSPESLIRVEQAIAALPLVQRDPGFASGFQRLARVSQPVFWALLEEVGSSEFYSAADLADIAQIDAATALKIVQMPFMSTSNEGADYSVLQYAKRLAMSDLASLQQILSHPRLHGGITDDHVATFALLVLRLKYPDVAGAIQSLPWVQDGVGRLLIDSDYDPRAGTNELEEGAVLKLVSMATQSREVAMAVVRKPWLQDGLAVWEYQVISRLSTIVDRDAESALQLVGMPFLDSITTTGTEKAILDALFTVLWISPNKQKGLRDLLAHPALDGGITDDQHALVELLAIGTRIPAIAAAINTLPWVQDGIDASEGRAVTTLHEVSRGTRELLPTLVQKSWVQDGLTVDEQDAIWVLMGISRSSPQPDEAAALSILDMPFLDDVDAIDIRVLNSLSSLHHVPAQSYLRKVLSHPTLRGGITDRQRTRLTFLGLVVSSDPKRHFPKMLDELLDPRKTSVEERVISLPRAGEVHLGVVHTRQGSFRTVDILESAVRRQERFMLEAFPEKFLGVLVAEITPAAGGVSVSGGRVIIDPGFENFTALVAHEVAHKYWSGVSPWLAEGGAELLSAVTEGVPLKVDDLSLSTCRLADNLSEIDWIESKPIPDEGTEVSHYATGGCPYAMGFGLFADLYSSLGDRTFRQGFHRLYLKVRDGAHRDTCVSLEMAVCLVKEAFVNDATAKAAAIAEPIIDLWYYGSRADIHKRGR